MELMGKLILSHESELSVLTAATSFAVIVQAESLKTDMHSLRKEAQAKGITEAPKARQSAAPPRVLSMALIIVELCKHLKPATEDEKK
eukprot:5768728-Amphidinium_carterae.1